MVLGERGAPLHSAALDPALDPSLSDSTLCFNLNMKWCNCK